MKFCGCTRKCLRGPEDYMYCIELIFLKEVEYMISTMLFAWILTWFSVDTLIINEINNIFNTSFTTATYWAVFILIGIIRHFNEEKND